MKYTVTFTDSDENTTSCEAFSADELGEMLVELLDERGPGSYLIEVEVSNE